MKAESVGEGAPSGRAARTAIKIVHLDIDRDELAVQPDDDHDAAWVFLHRWGRPQAVVELDHLDDAALTTALLKGRVDNVRATGPTGPRHETVGDLPTMSVVVPTIVGRVEDLGRLLGSLQALDYPDLEVIVVDNRPIRPVEDPLPALVGDRAGMRIIHEPIPGISAARNAGLRAARGEIVAFTDDDVCVDSAWLLAFGRRFAADPQVQALSGIILPMELETDAQICFERYFGGFVGTRSFVPLTVRASTSRAPWRRARVRSYDDDGHELRRFAVYGIGDIGAGANLASRRAALNRSGGFNLALGTGTPSRGGEDLASLIDILWRGESVGYEPGAIVHHRHRQDFAGLETQMAGSGIGFTAMLTSLIARDPGHAIGLASQLPLAALAIGRDTLSRLRGAGRGVSQGTNAQSPGTEPSAALSVAPVSSRSLVLLELAGYVRGPRAFVRSARQARD